MRLINRMYFICISTLFLYPWPVAATNQSAIQSIGITHQFSDQKLSIYVDQNKVIKNMSKLQMKGLVDRNLSNAEVSFYETQLAAMVSIPYTAKMIQDFYAANTKNDPLFVTTYIVNTYLYGNNAQSFCYSFSFNLELYQKINWNNFQPYNLVKIVPNLNASKQCKVIEETSPFSI